jgi:hypothetical protein
MQPRQMIGLGLRDAPADLTKQCVDEEPTTHANATMNPPYCELNAQIFQGFTPSQHVLVNAVDERPIEVK